MKARLPATAEQENEVRAILRHFQGIDGMRQIHDLLHRQLSVVHGRAQSLLQLAGVVITVTGFSGRIIADTNIYAQTLIIGGVGLVSLGAAVALLFVLPLKWLTMYMHLEPEAWLLAALQRRERKSRAFQIASALVVLGMTLYLAAVGIMLLYPEATELTRPR
jgi:hypothetical protein